MRVHTAAKNSGDIAAGWDMIRGQLAATLPQTRSRAGVLVPLALYLFATALLLVSIDAHPAFPYNWEDYTAWRFFPLWQHPSFDIFLRSEGLMTDSGTSPLIALPLWVGFWLLGPNLAGLRVPVALVAAGAVPLLWLVGKRLVGAWAAGLGALLLALSPVFLLYGRTATSVGISLVPALLTIYALLRVLKQPREWFWLLALQVLLLVGIYAYAPIRFLWPLSLGLIMIQSFRSRRDGSWLLLAFVLTALVLPVGLALTMRADESNPLIAVVYYYSGRGEQLAAMIEFPEALQHYAPVDPQQQAGDAAQLGTVELVWRLLVKNAGDYANLLLDRETAPAITDFWRVQGRLYTVVLAPFFLLGLALTLAGVRRRQSDLVLAALFLGFGLPLLLTSKVHIGRLIFELPLLLLIAARGYIVVVRRLGRWGWAVMARRRQAAPDRVPLGVPILTAALLLTLVVGWTTWNDYRIDPPPTVQSAEADILQRDLAENTRPGMAAVLVLGGSAASDVEYEEIHLGGIRLQLQDRYRFVDLARPADQSPPDGRPTLLYGGVLDLLADPAAIPNVCDNTYYVADSLAKSFAQATQQLIPTCGRVVRFKMIPG